MLCSLSQQPMRKEETRHRGSKTYRRHYYRLAPSTAASQFRSHLVVETLKFEFYLSCASLNLLLTFIVGFPTIPISYHFILLIIFSQASRQSSSNAVLMLR